MCVDEPSKFLCGSDAIRAGCRAIAVPGRDETSSVMIFEVGTAATARSREARGGGDDVTGLLLVRFVRSMLLFDALPPRPRPPPRPLPRPRTRPLPPRFLVGIFG